mgnify:CR=1 FL=1
MSGLNDDFNQAVPSDNEQHKVLRGIRVSLEKVKNFVVKKSPIDLGAPEADRDGVRKTLREIAISFAIFFVVPIVVGIIVLIVMFATKGVQVQQHGNTTSIYSSW